VSQSYKGSVMSILNGTFSVITKPLETLCLEVFCLVLFFIFSFFVTKRIAITSAYRAMESRWNRQKGSRSSTGTDFTLCNEKLLFTIPISPSN
jgi:hypothetical protein